MFCKKCGAPLSRGESYSHGGRDYCEDCYLEIVSVPKSCDPMAVRSARLSRERARQQGTEGLLPIQKNIYNYIKLHGRATREQIAAELHLEQEELEKHFAILRHCELVKGLKEGQKVYLILMEEEMI